MAKSKDLKDIASQPGYMADDAKMLEDTQKIDLVIFLESEADIEFYQYFFKDKNNCILKVPSNEDNAPKERSNKVKVINALLQKQKYGESNTIAITDADFDRITGENANIPNLFFTDYHDREIMLLECKSVWERLLDRLGSRKKIKEFEAINTANCKHKIYNIAREIAYFRLFNEQENINLKFKTTKKKRKNGRLEITKIEYLNKAFLNKDTLAINTSKLIKAIEDKSQKLNLFKNHPEYLQEIEKIKQENYEILELCNGHDVLDIFSFALEKAIGSKKYTEEELSTNAAIACSLTDFQTTQLYQDLKTHFEQQNYPMPLKTA